jgi:hypothetical protein
MENGVDKDIKWVYGSYKLPQFVDYPQQTFTWARVQVAAISDHMDKKLANRYIWWLAFYDDLLTFNLLSQAKKDGEFHRSLQ